MEERSNGERIEININIKAKEKLII